MAITFYHFGPSPPSRFALLTIKNLDLEVETKIVNLFAGEHKTGELITINPQHTVPTIVDDGFVLWESKAVGEYLVDSKSPNNSLYPTDAKERAIINQRLYFDATVLFPRVGAIAMPVFFQGETTVDEKKVTAVKQGLETLDGYLDGNDWMAGSNVTLADLAFLASVSTLAHMGFDISVYPNLSKWLENCKSLPGYDENEEGAAQFGQAFKSKATI